MINLSEKLGEMTFDGLITDIKPAPEVRGGVIRKRRIDFLSRNFHFDARRIAGMQPVQPILDERRTAFPFGRARRRRKRKQKREQH